MLSPTATTRIFVSTTPAHFSRSVDELARIVRDDFGVDPLSGHFFCFFNPRRSRVKILVWDGNGFWLMSKGLERGRFERITLREARVEIDHATLKMLLEGINSRTQKPRKHFAREIRIAPRGDDGCKRTTS